MGKKLSFFIFLITLLVSSFSLAQDYFKINIERPLYSPGETVLVRFSMGVFDLSKIKVEDAAGNRLGVAFFQSKIDNTTYYVYFNLPQSLAEGDYNFVIEEKRVIDGLLRVIKESAGFKVAYANESLSVLPAVKVIGGGDSFKITLKNVGANPLTVLVSPSTNAINPLRDSLSLAVAEEKNLFINYAFSKLNRSEERIGLSYGNKSYNVPLIIKKEFILPIINETKNETVTNNTELPMINVSEPLNITYTEPNLTAEEEPEEVLKFLTEKMSLEKIADQTKSFSGELRFTNTGDKPLHNLTFALSGNLNEVVSLSLIGLDVLQPGQVAKQTIIVNKDKNVSPKIFSGNLKLGSAEGHSASFYMFFEFKPAASPITVNETNISGAIHFNYSEYEKTPQPKKGLSPLVIVFVFLVIIAVILYFKFKKKTGKMGFNEYVRSVTKK